MSVAVRNAMLNAIETGIGTSAVLKIRTGAPPSGIADADSGDVLATMSLDSDWMAAADAGAKALTGTWSDTSADGAGEAGHFRLYASNSSTQHIQGTVTATGNGGDMTLDNINIAAGQTVTITGFTLTAGNA
jgi:hypothetical protein